MADDHKTPLGSALRSSVTAFRSGHIVTPMREMTSFEGAGSRRRSTSGGSNKTGRLIDYGEPQVSAAPSRLARYSRV